MYCSASPQPLSIYDFVQEGDSGIWLTNPDAELMYGDAGSGTVETVYLTDDRGNEVSPHVETLFHDGQGRLWLVTHDGAYVVDAASRRILAHYYLEDAPYSENNLCSYCVTSGSEIWFGTRGGGVNLLSRDGEYANFKDRTGEGLSGKTVFGILEDTVSKNVWFSTNSGLYYYDYVSRMIRKSQIDSPNLCGAYYVRACYKTSRGEMLFGGTDGFILFNPGKIGHNEQKPKVFFTDLLINSEPVKPRCQRLASEAVYNHDGLRRGRRQRHRAVAPAVESRNLLFGEQLPGRRKKSVCLPDAGTFRTLVPAPAGPEGGAVLQSARRKLCLRGQGR